MRARMLLAAAAAAFLLWPATAGAKPTAVAVINGAYEGIEFTTLVAVSRLTSDRVGVAIFRVDSESGGERYRLALAPGKCSKERPQGQALFQALVTNEQIVRRRAPLDKTAFAGGVSAYAFDGKTGEIFGCGALSKFSRVAQIVSPRDPHTGQSSGLVAVRKQRKRAHFTQLLGNLGDTATHEFGASRRRCSSENFTDDDELFDFKRVVTGSFMDYTDDAADLNSARSLVLVKQGAPRGAPEACGIWNFHVWADE